MAVGAYLAAKELGDELNIAAGVKVPDAFELRRILIGLACRQLLLDHVNYELLGGAVALRFSVLLYFRP